MKYTLLHRGKSVWKSTPTKFITWMRKSDRQRFETNKEFMEGYAHRKKTFESISLRPHSETTFIEDLESYGLLKRENIKRWLLF